MARIKGKYRAVIELDFDEEMTDSFLPFNKIKYEWENKLNCLIQKKLQYEVDPASCKVTQEIAEIELIEE